MTTLKLNAFAKINLFLEISGKRDDGFHELVTVMQEIDLADVLLFEEREKDVLLVCDDPDIPVGDDNLICKAANLLKNSRDVKKGVKISLSKKIPVGAGLGGGSSDAAAALRGLDKIWGTGCSDAELMEMGAEIGSDVPFFIKGGTAICRGRGEKISPIKINPEFFYVIIYPNVKISTVDIYKNFKLGLTKERKDVSFFLTQLQKGDPISFGKLLFNRLTDTIINTYPGMLKVIDLLKSYNFAGLLISGSGSSIYGLCERRCYAEEVKKELDKLNLSKVFVVSNCVKRN